MNKSQSILENKPDIVLDTDVWGPDRLCDVCGQPLGLGRTVVATDDGRTVVVIGKGQINGAKALKVYHSICYATLMAT